MNKKVFYIKQFALSNSHSQPIEIKTYLVGDSKEDVIQYFQTRDVFECSQSELEANVVVNDVTIQVKDFLKPWETK